MDDAWHGRVRRPGRSGDRVVFGGGLIGTVANVKDNVLVIKVSENTRLDVLRGSVTQVIRDTADLGAAIKE
ncbi:MAG: preprotein translocase subunit YajC [Lentisphaerae bacterium]|nr:preprotein translocase subunit YajC [Lentisphaerota bacterium]